MLKRIVAFILLIFILTACSSNDANKNDDRLHIYTSIYPLQYIVGELAGDKAVTESVYPPGVDAHTYEPTSREITQLADGDAFVYIGAGMEGFAETMADALNNQDISFIEIGQQETLFQDSKHDDHDHEDGHEHHGDLDPHIWLDPVRMIQIAELITNELVELQPENKDVFLENLSTFTEKMTVLDEKFAATLEDNAHHEILVSHAAYGYWEQRYGIEQIPISGLSSSNEPSQKELASIAKLAKDKDIKYVIFEQAGSNRIATIIQEHIEAEPLYIHNLEVLTEEDIENDKNYLSLMENNLKVLDKATK